MIGVHVTPAQATTYAARLAGYATCTDLWMPRYVSDPAPGSGMYDWTVPDADVAQLVAAGLTPLVHVQNNAGDWPILPAYPTDPVDYSAWLTALVNRYKPWVQRYAIENEATSVYSWGGTQNGYDALRQLAYPVIKAEYPGAIVCDSALCNPAQAVIRGRGYYLAGNLPYAQQIMTDSWMQFSGTLGPVRLPPVDIDWISFWLQPGIADCIAARNLLTANPGFYDRISLHHYRMTQWLASEINYFAAAWPTRPLEVWEVGGSYSVFQAINEADHARTVAKLMLTATGCGCDPVVYYPYVEKMTANPTRWHPGLIDSTGTPRQAEAAYRRVVLALGNYTATAILALGVDIVTYKFSGRWRGDLYAVWSEGADAVVNVPLGLAKAMVVNTVTGAMSFENPAALLVSSDPLLVQRVPKVGRH